MSCVWFVSCFHELENHTINSWFWFTPISKTTQNLNKNQSTWFWLTPINQTAQNSNKIHCLFFIHPHQLNCVGFKYKITSTWFWLDTHQPNSMESKLKKQLTNKFTNGEEINWVDPVTHLLQTSSSRNLTSLKFLRFLRTLRNGWRKNKVDIIWYIWSFLSSIYLHQRNWSTLYSILSMCHIMFLHMTIMCFSVILLHWRLVWLN